MPFLFQDAEEGEEITGPESALDNARPGGPRPDQPTQFQQTGN